MSNDTRESPLNILATTLSWSRERNYAGYSKHDALNSPLLNPLTFNSRILRLLATQAVMRSPVNIRPLFFVPRRRNPKGIGLFAHAYLDLACYLETSTVQEKTSFSATDCRNEAASLLSWLMNNASPWAQPSAELAAMFPESGSAGQARASDTSLVGLGWGYHYPWQDVGFFQPRAYPNRVVSCWIGFAFIRAFELTRERRYLVAAREIVSFVLDNPKKLTDTDEQLCLSYVPTVDIDVAVMDVSALSASLCAKVARHLHNRDDARMLLEQSDRLIRFVVDKQTDYGAWYYTWPAKQSHIKHDNYHTGIILDCLADYMSNSGDNRCRTAYEEGLEYYRKNLFLEDGAPKWMNDRTYPHDIHGAAAGIMTFDRAATYFRHERAEIDEDKAQHCSKVAEGVQGWTVDNLTNPSGHFYYQKTRLFTRKANLMRWCNAWMCRALAHHLAGINRQTG